MQLIDLFHCLQHHFNLHLPDFLRVLHWLTLHSRSGYESGETGLSLWASDFEPPSEAQTLEFNPSITDAPKKLKLKESKSKVEVESRTCPVGRFVVC